MRFTWGSAAIAAAIVIAAENANAQTCAVPANALSFDCDSSCPTNAACMLKDASTACDLECFSAASTIKFTFLIPYDTTVGDTKTTAFKSNDALTKIVKWKLPISITDVIIRGGSSLTTSKRATVAKVDIAEDFLADSTQVTMLQLANLNISSSITKLMAKFPPKPQVLYLQNDMLDELPKSIASFTSLVTLVLSNNYITSIDQSHEMNQLQVLRADINSITSFTALYPKLTYLDLAYNKLTEVPAVVSKYKLLKTLHLSGNLISEFKKEYALPTLTTLGLFGANLDKLDVPVMPNLAYLQLDNNLFKEIPPVVFSHNKLQELYIRGNTVLKNVTLTNQQANFIATLKNFTISDGAFSTDCVASQQTIVQGFTVCITGGAVDRSIIDGARLPSTTAPTKSGSSGSTSSQADGNETSKGKKPSGSSPSNTNTADADSSSSSTLPIILGVVAGVLAIALVAGFVYWRKNKPDATKTNNETNYTMVTGTMNGTNGTYTALWNDPDLLAVKVDSDDVQDLKKIGQGAFCDVWVVMYRKNQKLASKRLRDVTRTRTQEFVEEIKLVATLSHPSIVEFMGAAWTKESDLQALFEYMENGDLRTYLADERTTRAWSLQKVQIAVDIAEALVYVHSFNPPLVHRDLKSRNVLLNARMQAKLTDFGVSRFRSADNTMTAGVGTGKWLAPEVISGASDYGAPADIFSFGVVLSELDTHKLPYEDMRGANGAKIADVAMLQMVSAGKLRPAFTPSCPDKIMEMAQMCLSLRPLDRPTAAEVAYVLRSYKKSISNLYE